MWEIEYTNRFKRSFKRCIKRGLNVEVFATAVEILRQTGTLPPEYRPHKLSGKYTGYWECHLQPDWLLVWLPVAPHLYPAAMRPHHLPYKIQSQAEARSPRGTTA